MKIGVSGYQSIKQAVINIDDGEIVGITGDNAVGKSAIGRAIKAFICNTAGKDFINVDLKKVRVLVQSDRGLYRWDRSDSGATYTKNDTTLSKVNRAPLEDVFPGSGFLVEKEGSDIWVPSVISEGEQIFPFNVTPSIAFKIFSKFISSPKIGVISKEVRATIKEDKATLEKTRIRLNVAEQEYSSLIRRQLELPSREILVNLKERIVNVKMAKLKLERWTESIKKVDSKNSLEKEITEFSSPEIERLRDGVAAVVTKKLELKEIKALFQKMDFIGMSKKTLEKEVEEERSFLEKYSEKIKKIKRYKELLQRAVVLWERNKVEGKLNELGREKELLLERRKQFKFCPYCNQELL